MKKSRGIIILLVAAIIIIGFLVLFFSRNSVSKETLRLEILGPNTTFAGEEITYSVKYKNNGNLVLENPKIVFELPEHSLTENSKLRFSDNLEDIYPGQEGSLQFKGRVMGKEGDFAVAHAWLSYNPRNLSVRYESKTELSTRIDYVPIALSLTFDSRAERGSQMSYYINYSSSIDYPLENLSIKVNPTEGFTIKSSDPSSLDNSEWKLPVMEKNKGGKIRINGIVANDAESPLDLSFKMGMWQDGSFIVLKEERKEVAVATGNKPVPQFELSQRAFYKKLGEIENSGPIPPKVGETTTYSIVFEVKSKNVNLKNLKVKALLPSNVSLQDNLFPESEAPKFSFDNQSRQVTWSISNLSSGASSFLTFQVGLTPTLSQKGKLAELIGSATLYLEDEDGIPFQKSDPALDTSLPADQANSGGGIVQ